MVPPSRPARMLVPFAALALLAGCAGPSADGGLRDIERASSSRLSRDVSLQASELAERHVADLLARPLTEEAAVDIALLENRGLQAALADLRIARADYVQAGRLPNPGVSFGRLARGSELEIDRSVSFNLVRLLTLPMARRIESFRYEQARRRATLQVLALANRTRRAWIDAVASEQRARYLEQVRQSAEASAELARRMVGAGNWNSLSEARELAFRSEAVVNLANGRDLQNAARERLARSLGLPASRLDFKLPERLPDLPAEPQAESDVARRALAERLDVQSARLAAEATARDLGLTRATRFVNVLELGVARNAYNDGSTERGYAISLELPLFDFGEARVQRAEAVYMQALAEAATTARAAESEVRESYAAYRNRYEVARHYRDEAVPLAKKVAGEQLRRYNAMLIGVFELLADARAQIASVNSALGAQRDFWLAQVDLESALLGTPLAASEASRNLP